MASTLTRLRARENAISIVSAEEARRLDREAMLARQTYLRELLKEYGLVVAVESRMEQRFFSIQERAGAELVASELSWFLLNLGRFVKKSMTRKHAAGERAVKREMSKGLWTIVFMPFLLDMGCTISPDASTLGLNAATCIELFLIVGLDLRHVRKEGRLIRLAETKSIMMTKKRVNLIMKFWCEREQHDGAYSLR